MSVRDDYSFLTTYMEYGEEDEEEVDWDSVPSSHLYPQGRVGSTPTEGTTQRLENPAWPTIFYAINCIGFIAETVKTLV